MYVVKSRWSEDVLGEAKTLAEAKNLVQELEEEDNKYDAYEPESYLIIS